MHLSIMMDWGGGVGAGGRGSSPDSPDFGCGKYLVNPFKARLLPLFLPLFTPFFYPTLGKKGVKGGKKGLLVGKKWVS